MRNLNINRQPMIKGTSYVSLRELEQTTYSPEESKRLILENVRKFYAEKKYS